jgi:hypothetical protein
LGEKQKPLQYPIPEWCTSLFNKPRTEAFWRSNDWSRLHRDYPSPAADVLQCSAEPDAFLGGSICSKSTVLRVSTLLDRRDRLQKANNMQCRISIALGHLTRMLAARINRVASELSTNTAAATRSITVASRALTTAQTMLDDLLVTNRDLSATIDSITHEDIINAAHLSTDIAAFAKRQPSNDIKFILGSAVGEQITVARTASQNSAVLTLLRRAQTKSVQQITDPFQYRGQQQQYSTTAAPSQFRPSAKRNFQQNYSRQGTSRPYRGPAKSSNGPPASVPRADQ